MKKVITYGTFDMLHYGHVRLLERAKALGDYLIVGVTSDDYDRSRGKINVQQSLMERTEAVRDLGIADEIIVEEYAGQKIEDVRRYGVDIFAIGSDWAGHFDYLKEWCEVVYLPRTEGVSSTELRAKNNKLRLGLVGATAYLVKMLEQSKYVNGLEIVGVYANNTNPLPKPLKNLDLVTDDYDRLLGACDAVAIVSHPDTHYQYIRHALESNKHVLCETPLTLDPSQFDELQKTARDRGLLLVDAVKTAYSMAYSRLVLLVKSGRIGQVLSVDATCTSLRDLDFADEGSLTRTWNSICAWGPNAMLPIFQLLGTEYDRKSIRTLYADEPHRFDAFTKIDFDYPDAVASIKVAKGAKSEGSLVVTGTEGYAYVPAPWWKTDYFELRFEDPQKNKRYFYQLDGEGIRFELLSFMRAIENGGSGMYIEPKVSRAISEVMRDYYAGIDLVPIARMLTPDKDTSSIVNGDVTA